MPGIVWSISSDTCCTGRQHAPDNIAFDGYYREFVYRQPRNKDELIAVMRDSTLETFDSYRFDGLERWTVAGVQAWHEDSHVLSGYIDSCVNSGAEIDQSLRDYGDYLRSDEFVRYMVALEAHLQSRGTES